MKKNFVINTAFYVILAALALVFWKYLLPILMPFVIGFIVASIVQLPLNALHLKGRRRTKAAAIALCIAFYALLVWGMVFFSVKVIGEISNFAAAVPDLVYDYLYPLIWDIGDWVQNILEPIDMTLAQLVNEVGKTVASTLAKYATEASGWAVKTLATGVVGIPGALVTIIVTIVSSFYISADYQTVAAFLKRLIPAAYRDKVVEVVGYAEHTVAVYIKSYLLFFLLTTAELWLGFWLLDIPYKAGLSVGIAFFDLMPILGVGGILMPWGTIALLMGNFKIGLGIWGLYLGITAVRNFVEPKLVGHQIGLHPLATLIAMVVGLKLAGLAGMLLLPISLVAVMRMRRSTPKQEVSNAQS
ncbi:MAG: sporulation integral membrane protein YtvI [Oscillospiraceae bacterium]|nr:sporulation integral membrane protein YtvI [Oscillospiraceae bacterium]